MEELLQKWDLACLAEVFKENDINLDNFSKLNEELIKEMIPSIGKRIKFMENFKTYLKNSEEDQTLAPIINTQTPVIILNNDNMLDVEIDDNLSNASTSTNTSGDVYTVVPTENRQISFIGTEELATNCMNSIFPEFDLRTLLQISPLGNSVINYYEVHSTLNDTSRSRLVDIIIKHMYTFIIKHRLKHEDYNRIVAKIITLFPKESAGTYYVAAVQKRLSYCNKPLLARGRLVDKCRNLLYKSGDTVKVRKLKRRRSGMLMDNVADRSQKERVTEGEVECITWLKHHVEPWSEVLENWQKTFQIRKNCKARTVEEFLTEWPSLKDLRADSLINIDFDYIYPQRGLNLLLNWTHFIEKIFEVKDNVIKTNEHCLPFREILNEDVNDDTKFYCQLILLCYALPPKGRVQIDNKHWKFSTLETIEGIIVHAKTPGDVEKLVLQQKEKAAIRKQHLQPYILVEGPSIDELNNKYIIIDTIRYQHTTLIKAFDTLFKLFHSMNANYPVQSEHIFTLIQKIIYKIDTEADKRFPYLNDVMDMFKNA